MIAPLRRRRLRRPVWGACEDDTSPPRSLAEALLVAFVGGAAPLLCQYAIQKLDPAVFEEPGEGTEE